MSKLNMWLAIVAGLLILGFLTWCVGKATLDLAHEIETGVSNMYSPEEI